MTRRVLDAGAAFGYRPATLRMLARQGVFPNLSHQCPPNRWPLMLGEQEGEVCGRITDEVDECSGVLELRNRAEGGCSCFKAAPCSYCMSLVPECPSCGWRAEEP